MDINDVIISSNKMRKRGRPRKTKSQQKATQEREDIKSANDDDIIVCFPITSQDLVDAKLRREDLNISSQLSDIKQPSDEDDNDVEDTKTHDVISDRRGLKICPIKFPVDNINDDGTIVPSYTERACLWDTCKIRGIPCFLPDSFYDDNFYVVGMFCSLNCAVAYNIQLNDYKVNERYSLLKVLYGKTHENIEPAPSYQVLMKFGGMLSIKEYRQKLIAGDTEYRLISPPMTHISQSWEERIRRLPNTSPKRPSIVDYKLNKKRYNT